MKKTITLNPGESQIVAFSYMPISPKTYVVSVDGLSGSFRAVEVPQAQFMVSDLVIEPTEVYTSESVSISVVVTNVGGKAGSYEVTCEVI